MPATPFDSFGSPDWTETQGSTGGNFTNATTINASRSVTFHFRVVNGASPDGVVIESGATAQGMALSYDSSTNQLVGAAGAGFDTSGNNRTVFVFLDAANHASKTVDIYWCIRPAAPGRGKIYAFETDGTFLGIAYDNTDDNSAMSSSSWTGADEYGIGVVGDAIRAGVNASSFNGTMSVIEAWDDLLPSDFDDNTYAHEFTVDGIAGGAPQVAEGAIAQTHALEGIGLTGGPAEIGGALLARAYSLEGIGLAGGAPQVAENAISQAHLLDVDGIVAGAPVIGLTVVGPALKTAPVRVTYGKAGVSAVYGTARVSTTYGKAGRGITIGGTIEDL